MEVKTMLKCSGLLLLFAACSGYGKNTDVCISQKKLSVSYLHVAVDLIKKAEQSFPPCDKCGDNLPHKAIDCSDVLRMGNNKSGVYKISPMNRLTEDQSIDVYCDMETDGGGWTLLQRRGDFQRAKDYFFKDWKSYKEGFGDVGKDFWLGNDIIFALTNQRVYSARFDLQDFESNKRYAQYDTFWIDDENNDYRLHIADYSGDAGDSMIRQQNNQKFTTKDKKNDNRDDQNCALLFKGAWWYNKCHESNLNGQYLNGKHESSGDGVNWFSWKGYHESLQSTEIKVKPRNFRLPSTTTLQHSSATTVQRGMGNSVFAQPYGRQNSSHVVQPFSNTSSVHPYRIYGPYNAGSWRERSGTKSNFALPYGRQNSSHAVQPFSNTSLVHPYRAYGPYNDRYWRDRSSTKSNFALPYGRQNSSHAVQPYSNTTPTLLRPYIRYGINNATSWRDHLGTKPVWTRTYRRQ